MQSEMLSPTYFPFTFISPTLVEVVSLFFQRVVVYQPAYAKPDHALQSWIDSGLLDVRSPSEKMLDKKRVEAALRKHEKELKAQIELALKYIPQVSHLSFHMSAPSSTQELRQLAVKLSQEYNLPLGADGTEQYLGMWAVPAEQKEDYLANTLNNLQPGLWIFVCHPALNNQESQAIKGSGQDAHVRMAIHRDIVTKAVTSERIKQIIKDRHIQLIRYCDAFPSALQ